MRWRSGQCGLVAEAVVGAVERVVARAAGADRRADRGAGVAGDVAAQLLLHGNAFVQVLRGPADEAAALYALRPSG